MRTACLGILGVLLAAAPLSAMDPPHIPLPRGLEGRTCYECHIRGNGIVLRSQERPSRYSISNAFATYYASPHGRLKKLGDTRAPDCADCHLTQEWSQILPQSDPESPIHPDNLPGICARCHGDEIRSVNLAEGSMHLEITRRSFLPGYPLAARYSFLPGVTQQEAAYYVGKFDFVALLYYFYLALIVSLMSFLALYMILDMGHKLLQRRRDDG